MQNNGRDNITIPAGSTSFKFPTLVDNGSNYNVTVLTQPTNPQQICGVTNGTGKVDAGTNNNIAINCFVPGAASITIVSGDQQTVGQHQAVPTFYVVRVADNLNNPVAGTSVTFSSSTGFGLNNPATVTTGTDGTAMPPSRRVDPGWLNLPFFNWMGYFHTVGQHKIFATVTGLPAVTFNINVTPSGNQYDGLYECNGGTGFTINNGVVGIVSGMGVHNNAFSSTFNATTGNIQFASGTSFRYTYTGQIILDALQEATITGSYAMSTAVSAVINPVSWTCNRL